MLAAVTLNEGHEFRMVFRALGSKLTVPIEEEEPDTKFILCSRLSIGYLRDVFGVLFGRSWNVLVLGLGAKSWLSLAGLGLRCLTLFLWLLRFQWRSWG